VAETFERRVYLLSPRQFSPETIAVTFAKTSRSPQSFEEIAGQLSDESSAEFGEKWIVGFGHASVAEHAVLHVAFENVSRLAVEVLESHRLASYTEKSSRYQKWAPGCYHVPAEILGSPYESLYRETCDRLFTAYQESLAAVRRVVQLQVPRREDETEEHWEARIRTRYVDACRFLLPAAALANVGMTANARTLEHALRKMLSHPLAEARQIGLELRQAAAAELPTLLKRAEASDYLIRMEADLASLAEAVEPDGGRDILRLLAYDPEAESRVLAAALYPYAHGSFEKTLDHIRSLDKAGRRSLAEELLSRRERFDIPPRALEHAAYTFEAIVDQGAYFELKRHRMMTQTPHRLTAELGYAVPKLVTTGGYEIAYREAMEAAAAAYRTLAIWNPEVAGYVIPNGFNRRVLLTLNLREAYHFCELRSAANAHFSIRRLAYRMADMVGQVHPTLAAFIRLPEGDDWRKIEAEHFTQV
jgi:thymidylate synthase ThyX